MAKAREDFLANAPATAAALRGLFQAFTSGHTRDAASAWSVLSQGPFF